MLVLGPPRAWLSDAGGHRRRGWGMVVSGHGTCLGLVAVLCGARAPGLILVRGLAWVLMSPVT
jgi:hypothetical protein